MDLLILIGPDALIQEKLLSIVSYLVSPSLEFKENNNVSRSSSEVKY